MTTKISKILTMFVTVASVAFMGVIIANVKAGGPNWVAKAKEVPDVAFDRANPTAPWTAKRQTDGVDMGGGAILPQAISKAQQKIITDERAAQADLDTRITAQKNSTAEATAQIEVDKTAMKKRQELMGVQYAEVQKSLQQVSQDYTAEAKKQIDDLDTLKLRAEDYVRVKNQLEELRAQRQQATDELAQLKALLYQAKANLERARQRTKLLEEDGAKVYDVNEPPAKEAAPAKDGEAAKGEEAE